MTIEAEAEWPRLLKNLAEINKRLLKYQRRLLR
jgi:hypothetical protein